MISAVRSTPETIAGELLVFPDPLPYFRAWQLQQHCHRQRVEQQRPNTLILLEHSPVYTIGRNTKPADVPGGLEELQRSGADVAQVNRGGSVTYHGPGQLVGYPIIDLRRVASGPRRYVWLLEDVLIETLAAWDIVGRRVANLPGVFVEHEARLMKIASLGIRVDRGMTLHGFSLNVDLDLGPFGRIFPCGLRDYRQTSMADVVGHRVPLPAVRETVSRIFGQVFQLTWQPNPLESCDARQSNSFSLTAEEV
jgi:lipoate-protein ligase B